MTIKRKTRRRILEAVHETASDLHRLGFIGKRKMRKYDLLCLAPPKKAGASAEAPRPAAEPPG